MKSMFTATLILLSISSFATNNCSEKQIKDKNYIISQLEEVSSSYIQIKKDGTYYENYESLNEQAIVEDTVKKLAAKGIERSGRYSSGDGYFDIDATENYGKKTEVAYNTYWGFYFCSKESGLAKYRIGVGAGIGKEVNDRVDCECVKFSIDNRTSTSFTFR